MTSPAEVRREVLAEWLKYALLVLSFAWVALTLEFVAYAALAVCLVVIAYDEEMGPATERGIRRRVAAYGLAGGDVVALITGTLKMLTDHLSAGRISPWASSRALAAMARSAGLSQAQLAKLGEETGSDPGLYGPGPKPGRWERLKPYAPMLIMLLLWGWYMKGCR